jgi:hypothetical protein
MVVHGKFYQWRIGKTLLIEKNRNPVETAEWQPNWITKS